MAYPSAWLQWANGVLNGIGAPINDTNLSTLWNWSVHESGQDVTRWNNPLNTTQPGYGGTDMNEVGVKKYPDIGSGIAATVQTLKNGFYGNILGNLQSSTPQGQWGNAAHDLTTWGSGTGWLGLSAPVGNTTTPVIPTAFSLNPLDVFKPWVTWWGKPANVWTLGLTATATIMVLAGFYVYTRPSTAEEVTAR